MRVVLPEDMRAIDAYMIGQKKIGGFVLMENAAFGISACVMHRFDKRTKIYAVCGAGNNGGDGFAAARQLMANGYTVRTLLIGSAESLKGDALANAAFFIHEGLLFEAGDAANLAGSMQEITTGDVIIDALFGTGLSRPLEGLYLHAVERINASGAFVVAADIPSGIDSKTGQVLGAAVRADSTVTFQYAKPGHLIYPGREHTGELRVVKIGCDTGCPALSRDNWQAYPSDTDEISLPARSRNTHKGDYGHLGILAGGRGYTGAGYLCVSAALKSGAGLVTAGIPQSLAGVYQQKLNEAITFPIADEEGRFYEGSIGVAKEFLKGKNALAAGPGMTQNDDMLPLINMLVCEIEIPRVFDADALNLVAKDVGMLKNSRGDILLTPHPKEFSRLSGLFVQQILQNPAEAALDFAKAYGVTVLLKGATTIVAAPDGRVSFLLAGSAGMAKGGSGDVLTGVIASLLAQGLPVFDAAVAGAHICGLAGEAAAAACGEYAMTAMDTIQYLPEALKKITKQ
jgi:NAD(P)H-hydrate epimerase